MYEPGRMAAWLASTLAGAAPGGVWEGAAPLSATQTPYIVYQWQGGQDVSVIGAIRVWNESSWQVKAVGPVTDYATLQSVADTIDARLQRASGVGGTDGRILLCVRQRAMSLPEMVNGALWLNLIGLYDILAQPLT